MKTLEKDELVCKLNEVNYTDAYCLIKNNLELFRTSEEETREDIFNRVMFKYLKDIKGREDYMLDYKAALLNVNFLSRDIVFYLLDQGIDLNSLFDNRDGYKIRLIDRLVCHSDDGEVIKRVMELDKDSAEVKKYFDGNTYITSMGAYLKCGDVLEAKKEFFRSAYALANSKELNDVMKKYENEGYCMIDYNESKLFHYFNDMIRDLADSSYDIADKRVFLTMMLYGDGISFVDQDSLGMIMEILGKNLYEAYAVYLKEKMADGSKKLISITDDVMEEAVEKYSIVEKAPSFCLNWRDDKAKTYFIPKKS